MVYGIFTAGQRTWGGPRADAGKADKHTTPAQAIENGTLTGDELNVVPETFRPAIEATMMRLPNQILLLPSSSLEGRFVPAEELPGGWYRQANESGALYPAIKPWETEEMLYDRRPRRDSNESMQSDVSTMDSGYTPRRVESIFCPEDAVAYLERQHNSRPAGGVHYGEVNVRRAVPAFSNGPLRADRSMVSVQSLASESSVSLHFGVPHRVPTQPVNGIQETNDACPTLVRTPTRALPAQHHSSESTLAVPHAAHRPDQRHVRSSRTKTRRTDRSPLARRSFIRLASPTHDDDHMPMGAAEVIELERVAAARASLDAERRGRQRTDDRPRPRKLSKQRRGSRSISRD